jgi:hypothetical protein
MVYRRPHLTLTQFASCFSTNFRLIIRPSVSCHQCHMTTFLPAQAFTSKSRIWGREQPGQIVSFLFTHPVNFSEYMRVLLDVSGAGYY